MRTFGGGWRSRATIRSCSGQASVTGTRMSASRENVFARIAALTSGKPGAFA